MMGKVNKNSSPASRKTMMAHKELEEGNVTECNTWEDFLEVITQGRLVISDK